MYACTCSAARFTDIDTDATYADIAPRSGARWSGTSKRFIDVDINVRMHTYMRERGREMPRSGARWCGTSKRFTDIDVHINIYMGGRDSDRRRHMRIPPPPSRLAGPRLAALWREVKSFIAIGTDYTYGRERESA